MLLSGRVIQGFGVAGLLPLSLALISEVFPPHERGKAMGLWSTMGPVTGTIGPLLAGFIVAGWGWRASFVPPAIFAGLGLVVVYLKIPASSLHIRFKFLSSFDWTGVGVFAAMLTCLLFYFSSRPITGVAPLQDWRLLGLACFLLIAFGWVESRKDRPFIKLRLLKNRPFVVASLCAGLRMLQLSGSISFLLPLYLADITELDPTLSGLFLMTFPAAMVLFVRLGGILSDRRGSQTVVLTGFGIIAFIMFILSQMSRDTPYWLLITLLFAAGVGAGLMLASLHRAALINIPAPDIGASSGLYSMLRFLGSACGSVFAGILLQFYLERPGTTPVAAYQTVFLWFVGFALLGFSLALYLPNTEIG
jgi:MFS family permease